VAYIVGTREFHGIPIRVDRRVLVPRPDTETLVEVALERTRSRHLHGEGLDLCTGSGCIAIAIARRRPTWHLVGTDISADAVSVARDNTARLGAVWSVRFVVGDLDTGLPPDERFDLVTANPPYIPTAAIAELPPDVRDHEPRLALDGGPDGLAVVRRVVDVARQRLSPGGIVAIEVGHDQAGRTSALLGDAGFEAIERRRDYGGIERIVSGRWSGER
jgi:release factor glutamine methyltransferase